jgi:plastocyanin
MRGRPLKSVFASTEFLGVVLFVFCVVFPPFDDLTEVDLSLHMLQHVLIVAAGFMVVYPSLRRGRLPRLQKTWLGRIALLGAVVVFVFWHLPGQWDAAVLDPAVHAAEHFSFLFCGFMIALVARTLSDSAKIGALLLAFFGHMFYAVLLISPWNVVVYPLYSLEQQSTLGWILLLTGGVFLLGVAYILLKNPQWLQGATGGMRPQRQQSSQPLESSQNDQTSESSGGRRGRRNLGRVAAGLSLAMIVIVAGYFAISAVAASSAPSPSIQQGATVYIAETPVSWQYSPQNIRVVLGVNNTVTWVSHSIAYDTVTGDNGTFSSGLISPGQTYGFTFTRPGIYHYHCAYHPWMLGSVEVVSHG